MFKSHTKQEILKAFKNNKQVFLLDTNNCDGNDILIGSLSECLNNIYFQNNISKFPKDWFLEQISKEDFVLNFGN